MREVTPSRAFKNLYPKSVVANITVAYTTKVAGFKVLVYRWNTGYWSWRVPAFKLTERFFENRDDAVENAELILNNF